MGLNFGIEKLIDMKTCQTAKILINIWALSPSRFHAVFGNFGKIVSKHHPPEEFFPNRSIQPTNLTNLGLLRNDKIQKEKIKPPLLHHR